MSIEAPAAAPPRASAERMAPPAVIHSLGLPLASNENDIKILLDGDHLRVSAYVDLKGAKRLLKALKANMALLEEDDDDKNPDA